MYILPNPGTHDHVITRARLNQLRNSFRRVCAVRIGDDNHIVFGLVNARDQRRAITTVFRYRDQYDIVDGPQNLGGTVRGPVIDNDQFILDTGAVHNVPNTQNGGSPPEHGLTGALVTGGFVFFVANTLAIAYGTGSVGAVWVDWMTLVPGLGASFIGSLAGFLYGAAAGYLLGRTLGKLAGD